MKLILVFCLTGVTISGTAQQSNTHFSHSVTTQARPDQIWQIWTDVANWKDWDKGLKSASLEGAFRDGAKGILIADNGRKAKFVIEQVWPNQSYVMKTKIPFGWLIISRSMNVTGDTTQFTHDVRFTGILKKALGNKLGKRYREMLPEVMENIKSIAENKPTR